MLFTKHRIKCGGDMKRSINLCKSFKFGCICLLALLLAITHINVVSAANTPTQPYGKHKYYKGVCNVTVYIDYASGAGYWENFIKVAVNNWMYTGHGANPIYMKYVSSNNGSTMDIYTKKNSYWVSKGLGNSILAETLHYDSNWKYFNPKATVKNWVWTQIYINDDNFRKSSFSDEQAKGTIIHEMGHAFGLDHNNPNPKSIMCQTGAGREVQRVQKTDSDAINRLY